MTSRHNARNLALIFSMAVAQAVPLARAADFTWQVSSGNWGDPASWVDGAVPANDPATNLIFTAPEITGSFNATIDASRPLWQVNRITVNNTYGGMIQVAPGSALQFTGAAPSISYSGSVNSVTLAADLSLSSTLSVSNSYSGLLVPPAEMQLTGVISGGGGLSINGANVALSASNSFIGGVTLVCSTTAAMTAVHVEQPAALGSGDLTLQSIAGGIFGVQTLLDAGPGSSTNLGHTININDGISGSYNFAGNATNHAFVLPSVVTSGNPVISFSSSKTGNAVSWQLPALTYSGTLDIEGTDPVSLGTINGPANAVLKIGNTGGVHLTASGTYSIVEKGAATKIYADAPGALGTGTISNTGSIYLNATNAAQNSIFGSGTTFYNANGAGGGHLITNHVTFGSGVTSLSNGTASDTFSIAADQILSGPSSVLALLDRAIGSGATPNVTFAAHAQIASTDATLPAAQNLGTNADLVLRLSSPALSTVALGTGTPWGGVAAATGTFSVSGNIELGGGTFGDGNQGSFNIVNPPGQSPALVTVRLFSRFISSLSDFSGVSEFLVNQQLTLAAPNAMGGAAGTSPVSIEVPSTTTFPAKNLTVTNSAAINGPVHFQNTSYFEIAAPGLNGAGALTRDSGPMNFGLSDSLALTGPQFTPGFIHAGDSVYLIADDIEHLDEIAAGTNFYIQAQTSNSVHLHDGLNLNGSTLGIAFPNTNPPPSPLAFSPFGTVAPSPTATGANTITVGPLGATIEALFNSSIISVPFNVQGPLSLTGPIFSSLSFTSSANQFAAPLILNGPSLIISIPDTLQGATINALTSAKIIFRPPALSQVTTYPNDLNLMSGAILSDGFLGGLPYGAIPAPTPLGGISLGNITTSGSPSQGTSFVLNLNFTYQKLGVFIASLQVGNDVALTTASDVVTINSVSQADATSRALTISSSSFIRLSGNVNNTGLISVQGSLLLDGNVISAPAALTIGNFGTLFGSGSIHRSVQSSNGSTISPGGVVNTSGATAFIDDAPGTLSVDALTLSFRSTLRYEFGTPDVIGGLTDDLIAVAGNLTLDGSLQLPSGLPGPGRYTLCTYGGLLTDDGLVLPTAPSGFLYSLDLSTQGQVNLIESPVPEPASLASLALLASGFLLLTSRKPRRPR